MANVKVIAIVLAAIVVAGGVVAAVALNNNGSKIKEAKLSLADSELTPKLEVYGNVNGDLVIDSKDAEMLQKAINDGTTDKLSAYADANWDGTVNADDVTKINKIINATVAEPETVKHLCRFTNGDYYNISKVPIDSIVMSGSANMFMMCKYLGIASEIKGITYSGKIDSTLYPEYQTLFSDSAKKYTWDGSKTNTETLTYRVGGSAGYFNTELTTAMITNHGVKAIFTCDSAGTYLKGGSTSYADCLNEKGALDLNLGVFRFKAASTDMTEYISDLALMAFALHKDASNLPKLTEWCHNFLVDLNTKLTDNVGKKINQKNVAVTSAVLYKVDKDGKVTTYNYVSSGTSDYTAAAISAGGYFALDGYDFKSSSSSAKMEDLGVWLADYSIDTMIHIKTAATSASGGLKAFSWYGGTAKTDGKDTLIQGPMAFSKSEPYYNNAFYVVCGDMPIILRIAYCAHILYPGVFSDDWALDYNVSHSKEFLGMSEETIRSGTFYVSMADLGLDGKA